MRRLWRWHGNRQIPVSGYSQAGKTGDSWQIHNTNDQRERRFGVSLFCQCGSVAVDLAVYPAGTAVLTRHLDGFVKQELTDIAI